MPANDESYQSKILVTTALVWRDVWTENIRYLINRFRQALKYRVITITSVNRAWKRWKGLALDMHEVSLYAKTPFNGRYSIWLCRMPLPIPLHRFACKFVVNFRTNCRRTFSTITIYGTEIWRNWTTVKTQAFVWYGINRYCWELFH